MKRILMVVVALSAAALPATSNAGTETSGEVASRGGGDFQISLVVRSFDGEPTQIRKFEFKNLTATCNQGGPVDVKGKLGAMNINDAGKFDGKVTDSGGKVVVDGEVKNEGKTVKGTILAKGKFASASGCDSGKVKWLAGEPPNR